MQSILSKYTEIRPQVDSSSEDNHEHFKNQFDVMPIEGASLYLRNLTDGSQSKHCRINMNHGTTTLAFRYKHGIVVCVDSRASAGPLVASQTVKKVIEINPYLLGTMAGGAADCQFWETVLGMECRLHQLRNHELISVSSASKILSNIVYSYKGYGLSMGTMLAGTGKGGTALFYIDSDGTRLEGDLFSVGSGSTFAYGVLDAGYRWDLSKEEALYLGKRSILAATHRDAYSGGTINLYHIDEEGWKFHGNFDVDELIWETKAKEGSFAHIPTRE
ncbi:20S proteasome component beta 5 [Schizosaccharomyces japonicus yFS275]|uniref:Proteasome subunit beta n=1 Tax=Schizosaccharomyces japonicus (strain yFS275 / FY16936) TaxID=402676 RepID=B6K889_SCHJY|nr:20S proteasome component beta 5 [Schizosaccharomyces japonicus yFS275]EEB09743.2 20S proteasome component beta 5 [Schizosaccharomyces japonicus yFS275]